VLKRAKNKRLTFCNAALELSPVSLSSKTMPLLIESLNLLEELSLVASISSDTQEQELQKVIDENEQLRNHNNKLENDVEKHIQEQSAKITKNSYWFAIVLTILTPVGLLFLSNICALF
jgi:cell division protein FtsB